MDSRLTPIDAPQFSAFDWTFYAVAGGTKGDLIVVDGPKGGAILTSAAEVASGPNTYNVRTYDSPYAYVTRPTIEDVLVVAESRGWLATRDDRQARQDRIGAATANLPTQLNRADYERACANVRVTPMTDAEIERSYVVRHFQYDIDNDRDGSEAIMQAFAQRRLAAIVATLANDTAIVVRAEVACPVCGVQTCTSLLIGSSVYGNVCPDCYDRIEG